MKKNNKTTYYEHLGCNLALGNRKIGTDTLILNMGPAIGCPADTLGKCECADVCYAKRAERQYPNVRAYRDKQKKY